MKKLIIAVVLCMGLAPAFAQFKLSGKVLNNQEADTLYLNIPYVFGYYRSNNVAIPVDVKGNFKADIDLKQQKFATIDYHGVKTTLLLKPGKLLNIVLNPADSSVSNFEGSAAVENGLLYHLGLNKMAFYNKYELEKNPYRYLTPTEAQEKVFKPLQNMRDEQLALIAVSGLPAADKSLIAQEVRANTITLEANYARGLYHFTKQTEFVDLMISIFKDAKLQPDILPAGPIYYSFANEYIGYLEGQAFIDYQLHAANERDRMPLKFYGISLDSANKLVAKKGKLYMNWLAVRNTYDKTIAEPLLAQFIAQKCDEKVLDQALLLMNDMQKLYQQSSYLPELTDRINNLQAALVRNSNNPEIRIADNYEKITSIYQLLPQLKGKVVYLDIWGTWCGPCKEELTYNPQLKNHFKDKDVAFVYLDMDEDSKDDKWREFLKVNGLTGLHLRKNGKAIQSFWDELVADKSQRQLYPTYFIFDKTGKLVQPNAKRPSDQAELYKQIEQYL